ncbi:MAG TPA: hypothetical protein VNL69_07375 [Bacteroidota bacterium]|nr:hypothetical protein [Bacteroidota bacterium]
MKVRLVLGLLVVALTTMGFDCVNDNVLVAVNVTGLTATVNLTPGGTSFDATQTISASDYLDVGFEDINLNSFRVYDIRITTIGTFAGTVNAQVLVNGAQILSYSGPWSSFNTPQSLVSSQLITRNPAGMLTLLNAIRNRQDVQIRTTGTVSQALPSGLAVRIEVLAQVDAALTD